MEGIKASIEINHTKVSSACIIWENYRNKNQFPKPKGHHHIVIVTSVLLLDLKWFISKCQLLIKLLGIKKSLRIGTFMQVTGKLSSKHNKI